MKATIAIKISSKSFVSDISVKNCSLVSNESDRYYWTNSFIFIDEYGKIDAPIEISNIVIEDSLAFNAIHL